MPSNNFQHVNYVQTGAGLPVILVHGVAASLYDWKDLMPTLAEAGYQAYALDLLGHGESAKPENIDDYHIENTLEHFRAWIKALALTEPAVIVGHSLGGYLALEYTLRYPAEVRALVLSAPFYSLKQLAPLVQRVYHRQLINARLYKYTPRWLIRFLVDLSSLSLTTGRGMAFVLSDAVRVQTAEDYKRAAPGIFHVPRSMRSLLPHLDQIKCPVLVLYGTKDLTLHPGLFPPLVKALPNARGEAFEGAGHVFHQSHAEAFNKKVLEFLKGIEKPEARPDSP